MTRYPRTKYTIEALINVGMTYILIILEYRAVAL